MPIYEFQCYACQKSFEEVRSMNSLSLSWAICPICGGTAARVFSVPNLITEPKGNGYFESKEGYRSSGRNR